MLLSELIDVVDARDGLLDLGVYRDLAMTQATQWETLLSLEPLLKALWRAQPAMRTIPETLTNVLRVLMVDYPKASWAFEI